MTTREQVIGALQALVEGAYAWKTGPERRLKLWGDVQPAERPACFIFEGGDEEITFNNQNAVSRTTLNVKLFVYIDAKDPAIIGATALNNIMDALQSAFAPAGADMQFGRNTLGGLAYLCRIIGKPFKDPGDIDGDGILIVPIQIILP